MASNPASELASAIQSVSLNRAPSPSHDINPSTAASTKIPAVIVSPSHSRSSSQSSSQSLDSVPSSVLIAPRPRRKSFPPIPDFRFEQSYLASIAHADSNWRITYITVRDQVLMPLVQGIGWNLAIFGWRRWNSGARLSGNTLGARIRRWWYDVNNWKLPEKLKAKEAVTGKAAEAAEFFVNQSRTSLGD